jgi:hypothetical protein
METAPQATFSMRHRLLAVFEYNFDLNYSTPCPYVYDCEEAVVLPEVSSNCAVPPQLSRHDEARLRSKLAKGSKQDNI